MRSHGGVSNCEDSVATGRLCPSNRNLNMNLKIFVTVSKRPANPCFKPGVIVRQVATSWKPIAVEPLQRTQLQVEPTSYLDVGHNYWREFESTNLSLRGERFRFDGDI